MLGTQVLGNWCRGRSRRKFFFFFFWVRPAEVQNVFFVVGRRLERCSLRYEVSQLKPLPTSNLVYAATQAAGCMEPRPHVFVVVSLLGTIEALVDLPRFGRGRMKGVAHGHCTGLISLFLSSYIQNLAPEKKQSNTSYASCIIVARSGVVMPRPCRWGCQNSRTRIPTSSLTTPGIMAITNPQNTFMFQLVAVVARSTSTPRLQGDREHHAFGPCRILGDHVPRTRCLYGHIRQSTQREAPRVRQLTGGWEKSTPTNCCLARNSA